MGAGHLLAAILLLLAAMNAYADTGTPRVGDVVDTFNDVPVYYNGAISHSSGVNRAADGYVFGLRYQCVEFIKRYYYQRLGHRMPKPTGNARDYFDATVADGAINPARGLLQFRNGSPQGPQPEDILVFGPWPGNPYGHLGIISTVTADGIVIVQQNPGPKGRSRRPLSLLVSDSGTKVNSPWVLGWLRLLAQKPSAVAPASVLEPEPEIPDVPTLPEPSAKAP